MSPKEPIQPFAKAWASRLPMAAASAGPGAEGPSGRWRFGGGSVALGWRLGPLRSGGLVAVAFDAMLAGGEELSLGDGHGGAPVTRSWRHRQRDQKERYGPTQAGVTGP